MSEFGKNPAIVGLIQRLREEYRIPITDCLGAVGSGEEPDNPKEFVRKFETSPIQHEAALLIEQLVLHIDNYADVSDRHPDHEFLARNLLIGDPYLDGHESEAEIAYGNGRRDGWNDCVEWLDKGRKVIHFPKDYK